MKVTKQQLRQMIREAYGSTDWDARASEVPEHIVNVKDLVGWYKKNNRGLDPNFKMIQAWKRMKRIR